MSPVPAGQDVSIAIINYNGRRYLDELLTSLGAQTLTPSRTILIDNASADESVCYTRNNFPWVQALPQETNLGFARAGNLAIKTLETEFVALLNTDMKLAPDWLERLSAAARQDSTVAAVASKLRLYSDPTRLNGVGGAMNRIGYTWDRGMYELDEGQWDAPSEVLFASAGAALFRRSAFLQAGGFDERFFMYHEDVDLCWRLWLAGFRVITCPQAVAYHHFGGSTREARGLAWRELIGERNNIRALIKNYEARNLRRALIELATLRQIPRRKLGQIRNFAWNAWRLRDTLAERRRVQKSRVRSDSELAHLIVQSPNVPVRL